MKCGVCERRVGGHPRFCGSCGQPACKKCRNDDNCDDYIDKENRVRDREDEEFDERQLADDSMDG